MMKNENDSVLLFDDVHVHIVTGAFDIGGPGYKVSEGNFRVAFSSPSYPDNYELADVSAMFREKGYDSAISYPGDLNDEHGNMYVLFHGRVYFPDELAGFHRKHITFKGVEYTLICPKNFSPTLSPREKETLFRRSTERLCQFVKGLESKARWKIDNSMRHSVRDYKRPDNIEEIRAYIESKRRYGGIRTFDTETEYAETVANAVYKYKPKHYDKKIWTFVSKHFGIRLERDSNNKLLPLIAYDGREFCFDSLVELCHVYPLNEPDRDYLMMTNKKRTLIAGSDGKFALLDAWISAWGVSGD